MPVAATVTVAVAVTEAVRVLALAGWGGARARGRGRHRRHLAHARGDTSNTGARTATREQSAAGASVLTTRPPNYTAVRLAFENGNPLEGGPHFINQSWFFCLFYMFYDALRFITVSL